MGLIAFGAPYPAKKVVNKTVDKINKIAGIVFDRIVDNISKLLTKLPPKSTKLLRNVAYLQYLPIWT